MSSPQLPWLSAGPLPQRRRRRHRQRRTADDTAATPGAAGEAAARQTGDEQLTPRHDQNGSGTHVAVPGVGEVPATEIVAAVEAAAAAEVKATPKAPPKSWSALLKSPDGNSDAAHGQANGHGSNGGLKGYSFTNLPDLLGRYDPFGHATSPLIEPRGLINKGNMCFMNAVLQVLVYCPPFYNLFDRIGREVRQKINSRTPLMDAMVMFIREFRLLRELAAQTGKQGERAAQAALELIGDAFLPDNIYRSMAGNPRFSIMQRGNQEDAEEFLGFLLDGLHEEFVQAIREGGAGSGSAGGNELLRASAEALSATNSDAGASTDEWLEVGKKSKTSVTRTSAAASSPISRIFGGSLRSILKIGGAKDSVTLEPYQPLQLDIQAPDVHSITDALRKLPEPEVLSDDWINGKGLKVQATKQVLIETLPPVLILHLKRFLYDNVGGVQKSWKQVGYPLQLEIPSDAISPARRGKLQTRYKLLGVVYHHGHSASGGHYTVDVLRQDGKSWIHLDDTAIEPVDEKHVAVADIDPDRMPFTARPNKLAYILVYGQLPAA